MDSGHARPTMTNAFLVLLGSGATYTVVALTLLSLYTTSKFALYVASDSVSHDFIA